MNWLFKVAAFKLLSTIPGGSAVYRYCQENITHSLVPTPARVEQKIIAGFRYWDWLDARGISKQIANGASVDLGAGWHPTIPLLFYSLGADRQYLFDVAPIMTSKMIQDTLSTFLQIATDPSKPYHARIKRLPKIENLQNLSQGELLRALGMTYYAPYQDKFSEIAGSIDAITCTQVLQHVPREILRQCFCDLFRSLKPSGTFLCAVYLYDLYASGQKGLSQYNHLRYSPAVWNGIFNSSLMSFNRLKARDYREALEDAGFQVVQFDVEGPTESDLAELKKIPIHDSFNRYTPQELGAKQLFFVAVKS